MQVNATPNRATAAGSLLKSAGPKRGSPCGEDDFGATGLSYLSILIRGKHFRLIRLWLGLQRLFDCPPCLVLMMA
jgi:hypothetical protein